MTAPNIPLKFLKSLQPSGSFPGSAAGITEQGRYFLKLFYEFWGFCVNGSDSLTVPGGYAAVSGVIAPAGFESGSTVLWAQAKDGLTDFGDNLFHSDTVDFITLDTAGGGTGSMGQLYGKHLVTWKADSTSTDDGIYTIIGIVDNHTIRVQTETGGTRRLGNKAFFRKRSGINFRVVDIKAANNLAGWTDGTGVVCQFNRAGDVNPGQATSQVKISLRSNISAVAQADVGIIVSPSGSWNGINFTDGNPEIGANFFSTNGGFQSWTFIAGRDCMLLNMVPVDMVAVRANSGLYIEVPKRLYTASLDPNPVCYNIWSNATPSQLGNTFTNMHMKGEDGTVRSYLTLARCPWGDHIDTAVTAVSGGIWQGFTQTGASGRYVNFNYNSWSDMFMTSDAVLGCQAGGHFNFARARMRRIRFTSNNQYKGFRYGDIDWVFIANGVLWPWDNSMLGYGIFPENV